MSLLFLFFILVYGGMHYHLLIHVKGALHLSVSYIWGLGIFFTCMVISPIMIHIVDSRFSLFTTQVFAYISYCWMGLVFFFFCISLIIDLCRLALQGVQCVFSVEMLPFIPKPEFSFIVSLSLSLLLFFYSLYEAKDIRLEELVVKSEKLPSSVKKIRIVQISDLHIGLIMRGGRLKKVIDRIQEAQPDIVVSTGDLIDGQSDNLLSEYPYFHTLQPRFGKFAVTGNHELYAGLERSIDFTRRAGFFLLRREAVSVGGLLNIAGLDDVVVRRATHDPDRDVIFKKTLEGLAKDKFALFLYHRPTVEPDYLGTFDLQLSGHTHHGQIFPFTMVTHFFFPMQAGYFRLSSKSSLYVSRGTGTWGPPLRFLSPPQITVIDLLSKK